MNGTTETQQQWVVNGDGRHDGNSLDGDGRQWTARQRLESNGQIDGNGQRLNGDGRHGGTSMDGAVGRQWMAQWLLDCDGR